MRQLAQPRVMKSAGLAAVLTSLACLPRFLLWQNPYASWYLTLVLFTGSFVLWAFVFAWQTQYTGCPVIQRRIEPQLWITITLAGILVALVLHLFLDPTFRLRTPADYPTTWKQWLAMTAFALAFQPLFLTFAPLAWAARLFRRVPIAVGFTILFGVFVMFIKMRSAPTPLPPAVFWELLALRFVLGGVAVYAYLRGGVVLVWWWVLLLQARHLWTLASSANG
jgi:hypothetical protein